jgi:hypothetical protein
MTMKLLQGAVGEDAGSMVRIELVAARGGLIGYN